MAEIIRIPDGNAFLLRVTGQIKTGEYTENADFSVVTHMGVNFVRRGRVSQNFGLDTLGRIVIENSGNLAQGVYGVELYGYYHGEPWRFFQKNVFHIVNENVNADPGTGNENTQTYDVSFEVSFGGEGISAAFVEATVATHNGDQESHSDIREMIPTKVSELQNDSDFADKTYVDNKASAAGKVDDVTVNGVSVLNDKTAEITMPTKVSELQNDSDFADKTYVNLGLSGKQDVIDDLSTIRSGAAAGGTAYQKPGTGIPASDLSSEVQDMIENGGKTKSVSVNGGTPVTPDANGLVDLTIEQTNVTIGTVTTGSAGSDAEVHNSGTGTAPVLDFVIPKGDPLTFNDLTEEQKAALKGEKGDPGDSAVYDPSSPDTPDFVMANTTGQSTTKAMTQKAVTDEVDRIDGKLNTNFGDYYLPAVTTSDAAVTGKYVSNGGGINNSSTSTMTVAYYAVPQGYTIDKVRVVVPKTGNNASKVVSGSNATSGSVTVLNGTGNTGAYDAVVNLTTAYTYIVVNYNSAGGTPSLYFHVA